MEKQTRTTLYISEQLMIRFREACNKMFGDRQGKIKQGSVLAITDWCDKVLVSGTTAIIPTVSAKKLLEASVQREAESSVALDQDEESIEAKAKKLAEERRKEQDEHKVLT